MKWGRAAGAALAAAAAVAIGACGGDGSEPPPPPARERAAPSERGERPVRSRGGPEVETLATGLEVPWEIAFLPDGRALVTERAGRVRLLGRDGRLKRRPAARVARVRELGEGGLLGMALDPAFARNGLVYLYRTTAGGNEVARFRLVGERLREETTIVRGIAAAAVHDGGRLRFGPDRRLYVATGDAAEPGRAQDPGSLNGKILRLAPAAYRGAGGRPEVFSLGHRNPQGFGWQPRGGRLVATDHGAVGNDEVNVLRRGANYGWPIVEGAERRPGMVSPVAVYAESIAPSGATFVRRGGSAWTGDFLIACLVGEQIRRVGLRGGRVTRDQPLFEGRFGRLRSVVEGPDGALYALTSNRDGRGSPRSGDDRVLRIVPPAG